MTVRLDGTWEKLRDVVSREQRVDEHGIIHLEEEDFYYREVPRSFFDGVLAAPTRESALDAFREALDRLPPDQRSYVREYALDPTRAIAVMLGDIGDDRTVLDYGCGWGTITRTLSELGCNVVAMDPTYESLLLSRFLSESPNELYIKGGRALPLPFESNTFDTIILNGVLEWLPDGHLPDVDPRDVQMLYLREFQRILKPGGRVIIAIENRHSLLYWAGQREDHTALRFGALLPRFAADVYSRAVRGRPYRTYTYTRRGYRTLLSETGFEAVQLWVPWLRYRRPELLLSEDAIATFPLASRMRGRSFLGKIARRVLPLAQRWNLLHRLAPDYCICARKPPSGRSSFVERAIDRPAADGRGTVISTSSVPAFHVTTSVDFLKVPLTTQARARLAREVHALESLRGMPVDLAGMTVDTSGCRLAPGAAYARFPRIDTAVPSADDDERKDALIGTFLDRLGADARMMPIGDTDLGGRLDASDGEDLMSFLGASGMRELESLSRKKVPAGLVHGDLCRQNALLSASGSIVVVDWDRSEAASPKLLDPLHWAIDAGIKSRGAPLASAVTDALALRGGDILERAASLCGELSGKEMLLLYLVDRLMKDVSASDWSPWVELSGGSAARRADACHGPEWSRSYRRAFEAVLGAR